MGIIGIDALSIIETVINVLVLFLILRFFLFKPVNEVLEKRRQSIVEEKLKAEEAVKNAEDKVRKYESDMQDIEKAKADAVAESKKKAVLEYDRIVGDAEKKASEIISEAEAKASAEQRKKRQEAEKEIAELITKATGKIAASQSGSELDKNLYDEFIAKAGEDIG